MTTVGKRDLDFVVCQLCDQSTDLQSSHVVPSFVFQWLRDTGGSDFLRFAETPNRRVQDGWKPKMLCTVCEQRFSVWEKAFAENCFNPINSGNAARIRYQTWMLKFAVSVSWRVLCAFRAISGLSGFPPDAVAAADQALRTWAEFLLDRRPHPGVHEQHMLLFDRIKSSTIPDMPANINRYLMRAIEVYVAHNSTGAITYAKMGRVVLFGFIRMDQPRQWKGTKLNANEGTFGAGKVTLPGSVGTFIMDRARRLALKMTDISDRQQGKMAETFRRDLDRLANSDSFRALHHDVMMFGEDEAFRIMRRP